MSSRFQQFEDDLKSRYSCRAYTDQLVSVSDIEDIVRAAGRAPSWCNAQPWQVVVVRSEVGKELSEKMVQAAAEENYSTDFVWPKKYTREFGNRRRECGYQLYDAVGVAREDYDGRTEQMLRNYTYFDAPQMAIITTEEELGLYGATDCGGFITLFQMAAQAKGIGSIAQGSIAAFAEIIRDHLNLPANRKILCGISFGYELEDQPVNSFRTTRADVEDVLTVCG
ncbi:MAG: nitroreductase [Pseudomonadota bacterium]